MGECGMLMELPSVTNQIAQFFLSSIAKPVSQQKMVFHSPILRFSLSKEAPTLTS